MNFIPRKPARRFNVGRKKSITLSDGGQMDLLPDEQITFSTPAGAEYDVCRKSWGFYATPSLNGRLKKFGLRTALMKNAEGLHYIVLVEKGKEKDFSDYLKQEEQEVVAWMDSDESLAAFGGKAKGD